MLLQTSYPTYLSLLIEESEIRNREIGGHTNTSLILIYNIEIHTAISNSHAYRDIGSGY